MDLLMQAGLDMDIRNKRGETPQLMTSAPDELSRWWYDKLTKQSLEAKTNLVAAANAVSVTAALVATASFVGPLQPPLGLSSSTEEWLTGYSQVNHTAVQVFLFCDSLSFYLAIASIMLAVIPSLTIQKEVATLEVRIAKRVVQWAVILLLVSMMFVICAFSAATIAIVPESRWHYKGLAVVTIIVGGFFCVSASCLFLLRLAKLIRPNENNWVAKLTRYIFSEKRKEQSPSSGKSDDSGLKVDETKESEESSDESEDSDVSSDETQDSKVNKDAIEDSNVSSQEVSAFPKSRSFTLSSGGVKSKVDSEVSTRDSSQ